MNHASAPGRIPGWRDGDDGVPRIRIRVSVDLSLDDVAMILARVDAAGVGVDALPGGGLRHEVRKALLWQGASMRDRDDDLLDDDHYRMAARAYGQPC